MRSTVMREGETAQMLCERLQVPLCMLLRANRLFSAAWLLPNREINVPDKDFCVKDTFPCPNNAMCLPPLPHRYYIAGKNETRREIARSCGVPERFVPPNTRAMCLPCTGSGWKTRTVKPCETVSPSVRAINRLGSRVYPGTMIFEKYDEESRPK